MLGGTFGIQEIIVIAVLAVVLLFGPAQIPKAMKSLGEGIWEWRRVKAETDEIMDEVKSTADAANGG